MKKNYWVPPLNQIALSVVDLRLTERWFREGFGLLPAGGSRRMMRGKQAASIQGLAGAASTCWWLVGRNPWFQLELFQFEQPIAKLMPLDFRPCDIGYTRIGIWVADFDLTLNNLAALGTKPLSDPIGGTAARRACVRSPDGVFVEIMEDDPLAGCVPDERAICPAAIRSVTMSVPDLDESSIFLLNGIGISPSEIELHRPEHETLWGLPNATSHSKIFNAGDVLVEVVEYVNPIGKPWRKNYRINDQGILNIAFGARNKHDHNALFQRSLAANAKPNSKPLQLPGAGVVYVNDRQGFSFELLWMKPGLSDRLWGFLPRPIHKRPAPDTQCIEQHIHFNASIDHVWQALADHEGMGRWSGFPEVTLIHDGELGDGAYGAQRLMKGPLGIVTEQITTWQPLQGYRYRIIKGSPFTCHQGELTLTENGEGTDLVWTIRFRPRLPFMGALLRRILNSKLQEALHKELKPLLER